MDVHLTHQFYAASAVGWDGETLHIDGSAFDLSPLAEGDVLPAGTLPHQATDATRTDGKVSIGIAVHDMDQDGSHRAASAASVDWAARVDAEAAAAVALEEWRANVSLNKAEFAAALMRDGVLSEAEADAWVSTGTLPVGAQAAILTLPAAEQATSRLRAKGAVYINRSHPLVSLLAGAYSLTEAQVDALFS